MQAIQTKYFAPTNCKGSRIKAICAAKTITISYNHALNIEENHTLAADLLAGSLGWLEKNKLECGFLKDGSYVHVLVERNK